MEFSLYIGTRKYSLKSEDEITKMYPEEFNVNYKILKGNKDILKDLQVAYKNIFQESIDKFNKKNPEKEIKSYYCKINDSKKLSLATGILVKISGRNYEILKNDKKIVELFKNQLKEVKKLLPNFYIVSAILYYENAFKLRIIGIPYVVDSSNELDIRISKSSSFTKEKIEELRLNLQLQAKSDYLKFFYKKLSSQQLFERKQIKRKKEIIQIEQLRLFQVN